MTFETDVAADIATIGGSTTITIYVVTETKDGYGGVKNTYDGGTSATVIVSRVPKEKVLKEFGEITGEVIVIHLPYTATIKERDRVTYNSKNWTVLKVVDSYYETVGLSKKTAWARREVPSA